MQTGTAILMAGALIAGAIVAVNWQGTDESPSTTQDELRADAAGPAAEPRLETASPDVQLRRSEAELAKARGEIERLKAQGKAATNDEAPVASTPALIAQRNARFVELGQRYADGTASDKEVAELLALTKDKVLMARVVGGLEKQIAENPDDLAARLQLVNVQSARVHSADSITERAMLRDQVRDQLGEVLARDGENWDARYIQTVGISHSQRTPQGRAAAIKGFDALIVLQQARSAEPRFAATYGQLAGVHLAQQDVSKARAALMAGLARYPDDKDLRARLAKLPAEDD